MFGQPPSWLTELPLLGVVVDGFSGGLCFGVGEELSTRRRRGTGDTESSKINGLLESKTYDTYASSSGYSSEDDYTGRDALVSAVAGMLAEVDTRGPAQGLVVSRVLPASVQSYCTG